MWASVSPVSSPGHSLSTLLLPPTNSLEAKPQDGSHAADLVFAVGGLEEEEAIFRKLWPRPCSSSRGCARGRGWACGRPCCFPDFPAQGFSEESSCGEKTARADSRRLSSAPRGASPGHPPPTVPTLLGHRGARALVRPHGGGHLGGPLGAQGHPWCRCRLKPRAPDRTPSGEGVRTQEMEAQGASTHRNRLTLRALLTVAAGVSLQGTFREHLPRVCTCKVLGTQESPPHVECMLPRHPLQPCPALPTPLPHSVSSTPSRPPGTKCTWSSMRGGHRCRAHTWA